jgi:transposase
VWFEDESRFGLITKNGKILTSRGIRPICRFQQVFKSTWLYGAFAPETGGKFFLELPACNTECFQVFLDQFSMQNADRISIMVLDNGAFHKAERLNIPENIRLFFLPPYSPELNTAEKIWQKFKRKYTNKFFETVEDMRKFISELVISLKKEEVMTRCNCKYWKK